MPEVFPSGDPFFLLSLFLTGSPYMFRLAFSPPWPPECWNRGQAWLYLADIFFRPHQQHLTYSVWHFTPANETYLSLHFVSPQCKLPEKGGGLCENFAMLGI